MHFALYTNTTGSNNTASGFNALYVNSTGGNNTATDYSTMVANTTGVDNTANGYQTLFSSRWSAARWRKIYSNVRFASGER